MEHCVQAGAAFVISPCCYGFIQNAVKFTFPKRFVSSRSGLFFVSIAVICFDLASLIGSRWLEEVFSSPAPHAHCHFVECVHTSTAWTPRQRVFAPPPFPSCCLITADRGVAVSSHIQNRVSPYHIQYEPASLGTKRGETVFFLFVCFFIENSKLCITFCLLEIIKANSHREKVEREALQWLLIPLPWQLLAD